MPTTTAERPGTLAAEAEGEADPVEWASRFSAAIVPLGRLLRSVARDRFTPTQLSVLGSIARHGPLSLRDLAGRERLSPPSITKVVAVLETEGVVERLPDPGDRRVCLVRTTEAGAAWLEAGRVERDAWLGVRLGTLPEDQRAAIEAALPALETLLGADG